MANWAQNWVEFSGAENNLQNLKSCFKLMQENGNKTNEGQLPSFIKEPKQDYFFDIYVDETDTISYNTKWSPNVLDLIEIANYFELGFIVSYQETSSYIFGKAVFTFGNSEAQYFDLQKEDFELCEFDEENDIYIFEGETNESEEDILTTIFERKFKTNY